MEKRESGWLTLGVLYISMIPAVMIEWASRWMIKGCWAFFWPNDWNDVSCLNVTPDAYPFSFFSSFTELVESIFGRATPEDATDITKTIEK